MVEKELMRKLDLMLSPEPWTSVENLMSQVEVWPHLHTHTTQVWKTSTGMQGRYHNTSNVSKQPQPQNLPPSSSKKSHPLWAHLALGETCARVHEKQTYHSGAENVFSGEGPDWKGGSGTPVTDAVAQWAWFGLVATWKKEALLFPAEC